MPTFAAVDIGSNSVRLKIARLDRRLQTLHEDREVTRLGAEVFRTGVLDPSAIARTARALQRFHRATQSHGVTDVRIVATSALRDARNARSFLEWVHSATGWNVEIISGLEEGRLIHLGVLAGSRLAGRNLLLVDLGGGSCELTLSVAGHLRHMVSLPVGAVRLTEEFLPHDPPKKKEVAALREFIAQELKRVQSRFTGERISIAVATSGTAAALADLWRARRHNLRLTTVPRSGVIKLAGELAELPLPERRALAGIGPRRAEIIVAGATVFAELMATLGLASFRYSPLGLRDGLLAQMQADYDRSARVRRQIEAERRDALLDMSRHYGVDRARAQRIRDLAAQLFRELRPLHQLPAEYGEWLAAAALLHEVGSFLNRNGRHRHAHYIIAHSEIFGYTVRERRIIAAIARYVGKSLPTLTDRPIRMLQSADRLLVPRAVALLRLARALDQGRRGLVKQVRARVRRGEVRLALKTQRRGAELELWAVDKERNYFRALFAAELVAELASYSTRTTLGVRHHCSVAERLPVTSTLATAPLRSSTAALLVPELTSRLRNSLKLGLCPTTSTASCASCRRNSAWNAENAASGRSPSSMSSFPSKPVSLATSAAVCVERLRGLLSTASTCTSSAASARPTSCACRMPSLSSGRRSSLSGLALCCPALAWRRK